MIIKNKPVAKLHLSDDELATIFVYLSDEIEELRYISNDAETSMDDKISIAKDLKSLLPIHQKLKKFFNDAKINIKVEDIDYGLLGSYDIDTNL